MRVLASPPLSVRQLARLVPVGKKRTAKGGMAQALVNRLFDDVTGSK